MHPVPFALERFFARYEFSARFLLSASDCQGPAMADLVAVADDDLRARWKRLELGYTESQGLPDLRAEIATLYGRVDVEHVVVAAPEEAIFLTMHALLSPGDHVVCTFPGYQSLYELARSIGCTVDLWEPEEQSSGEQAHGEQSPARPSLAEQPPGRRSRGEQPLGEWSPGWQSRWWFDPATLRTLLRPETKLVVLNFPHNPTGALPSGAEFAGMVDAIAGVGAWLFSDEMYRLLEPAPPLRLPAAADLYERAISLAGMSKAFGLAGLRIGWVALHDPALLERIKSLKDYTTICSSAPSELLALMGLRSREEILRTNRARIEQNQHAADAFFERYRDRFRWAPPQAGTVCFPRLLGPPGAANAGRHASAPPGGAAAGGQAAASGAGVAPPAASWGAEAFCARLREHAGVLLLPSTVYGYGDSHFRLGLGRNDFAAGLEVLDRSLAAGADLTR